MTHPGHGDKGQLKLLLTRADGLRRAGRLAEAIAPLERAAMLAPGDATVLHDLGLTLLTCRQPARAVAALRRAVAADPRFAEAFWRLGMALEAVGDLPSALAAYERACALRRTLSHAQFRSAVLLEALGRKAEALKVYQAGAAAAQNADLRQHMKVRALQLEGRDDLAERVLRRWQAASPDNLDANQLLAYELANAGDFAAAEVLIEKVLATDPRRVGLYFELVRGRRITEETRAIVDRMRAAAVQPGLEPMPLSKLYVAIGKALDDLGEYEDAMKAFDEAYAIRRPRQLADPKDFEASVDRLIRLFSAEAVNALAPKGLEARTPVLIVGMPRSGTTLLEQIVSAHQQAAGGGELSFWSERGSALMASDPPTVDRGWAEAAGKAYLDLLKGLAPAADRVTDKDPFNFLWAGLIHIALPNAIILHCRRSAVDTALSIHQTGTFALEVPTGGPELVSYFRSYERLMAHWRAVLPPDRFLEVEYEALTADPALVIREAVAFCGLPWDEACLHPEANRRQVKTPSKWQVRQAIGGGSVGRWRRYEPWLGPLAELVTNADRTR